MADVHLGRLARLLRMLGFDTAYNTAWSKPQLLKTAVTENRILLSRNRALSKNPFLQSFIVDSEKAPQQLEGVLTYFQLYHLLRPFSRCMVCNHPLQPVAKEAVLQLLQPQTLCHHQQFWQCPHCSRVYWQGSHYNRMLQQIRGLKQG